MKKINIIDLVIRKNKKNKKPVDNPITYDEDAVGYEAFPSKYLDKIIKNYRYSMRFFNKKEKISASDI